MSLPRGEPTAPVATTRVDLPAPLRAQATVWEVRGEWLGRLRAEFPEWGFLFDPFAGVWVGVRGRWRTEVAATAIELYERLKAQRPKKDIPGA